MNTIQIPQTDSIEELARFWDEHDLTEFEDELEEVTEPVFIRDKTAVVKIQLSPNELEQVKRLAKSKGVKYTSLLQEWVHEKLQAA